MKIYKLFIFALVILLTTFATTSAQEQPQKAVLVSTVNIQNTKIKEQVKNIIQISFDISNQQGLQSGVKYGVQLVSGDKNQTIVDEKIYDEVLTVAPNNTINKNIVYSAPENISGNYRVLVIVTNSSGFPFGVTLAGKITLSASSKAVYIAPESCFLQIAYMNQAPKHTLSEGVILPEGALLNLTCTATNQLSSPISLIPNYETRYRSGAGEVVEQTGGDVKQVDFKAKEKKTFSLLLPKANSPQAYSLSVELKNGGIESNVIKIQYAINGVSGTIIKVSTDKDFYQKNEVANISTLISSNGIEGPVTLSLTMKDDKGRMCAQKFSKQIEKANGPKVDIEFNIKRSCFNPKITAVLSSGKDVLDQKDFDIKTTSVDRPEEPFTTRYFVPILIAIMAIIIGAYIYMKKKNTPKVILPVLVFIVSLGLASVGSAHAYVFVYQGTGADADIYTGVNSVASVYSPSNPILIDATIWSAKSGSIVNQVGLKVVGAPNNSLTTVIPLTNITGQGPGVSGFVTFTADPNCALPTCSYTLDFTTSVGPDQTPPPVIGTVFSIGPHMHGATYYRKVVYVGQAQHPELTVRVKNYGQLVDPYINTTNPNPPNNLDQIYTIPATTSSASTIQYASCTSNCGIPLNGFNYSVVSSVIGAGVTVGTYIPNGYHVCKYPDAPGPGQYFSPAYWGGSFVDDTCQNRYPDAEVVW